MKKSKPFSALLFSTLTLLLLLRSGPAFAQGTDSTVLVTYTKPVPAPYSNFGVALAADRNHVLIGANTENINATFDGAAYLFNLDGALLTTFTNPTPSDYAGFGQAVALVGSDKVLIGAPGDNTGGSSAGSAYLFGTNGTLLTAFHNPAATNKNGFGFSVAAVGKDLLAIGAYQNNGGNFQSGSAYLFNTNGDLLSTFSNPNQTYNGNFGSSVKAFGDDRVLIAARFGAAVYLFSTNGNLLTSIFDPNSAVADHFGSAIAAVGTNAIAVTAPNDNTGATQAGIAYLFDTNGTFITTFSKPIPTQFYAFGTSIAAVGNNRVLISAPFDSTGASTSGIAYLFSTNGSLITIVTNPVPTDFGEFANAMTTVDSDRMLFGATGNAAGEVANGGAAYLMTIPYPPLSIARNAAAISVSWSTTESGLFLQQTERLATPISWSNTTESAVVDGTSNVVQQPFGNGITNRFYRLRR